MKCKCSSFFALFVFLICSILIRTNWEFIVSSVTKCGEIFGFHFRRASKLGFYRKFPLDPVLYTSSSWLSYNVAKISSIAGFQPFA